MSGHAPALYTDIPPHAEEKRNLRTAIAASCDDPERTKSLAKGDRPSGGI